MKKGTFICVLLASAAILGLCALAVFLTLRYGDDLSPARTGRTESEAQAAILALRETAGFAQEADARAALGQPEKGRLPSGAGSSAESELPGETGAAGESGADAAAQAACIWVGDSRTLGMKEALDNDDIYIGAAGEGYRWFVKTGLKEMEQAVRDNPDVPVVINFGVNDYDNLDRYMELYESLVSGHPDTRFYFLSVNPIDPELCDNITNEEISDFNSHLEALFPDAYLDSYSLILDREIVPPDGVHYTKDDYRLIYRFVTDQIAQKESRKTAND